MDILLKSAWGKGEGEEGPEEESEEGPAAVV